MAASFDVWGGEVEECTQGLCFQLAAGGSVPLGSSDLLGMLSLTADREKGGKQQRCSRSAGTTAGRCREGRGKSLGTPGPFKYPYYGKPHAGQRMAIVAPVPSRARQQFPPSASHFPSSCSPISFVLASHALEQLRRSGMPKTGSVGG